MESTGIAIWRSVKAPMFSLQLTVVTH